MHNRVGPGVDSREITLSDGAVLVPLVAVILFLALYPQLALHRSERSVKVAVASAPRWLSQPEPHDSRGAPRRSDPSVEPPAAGCREDGRTRDRSRDGQDQA